MLKPKRVGDICIDDEWIDSFQSAITSQNVQAIHLLLHILPQFQTYDKMKKVLVLSMDAEALICNVRQELVDKRASIASQYFS